MPTHTITLTVTPSTKTMVLTSGVFVLGDTVAIDVVNSEGNWSGALSYTLTLKEQGDYGGTAIVSHSSFTGGGTNTLSASSVDLNPTDIRNRLRGDNLLMMGDFIDTTDTMYGKMTNNTSTWRLS